MRENARVFDSGLHALCGGIAGNRHAGVPDIWTTVSIKVKLSVFGAAGQHSAIRRRLPAQGAAPGRFRIKRFKKLAFIIP
jgi:hypothetical protein